MKEVQSAVADFIGMLERYDAINAGKNGCYVIPAFIDALKFINTLLEEGTLNFLTNFLARQLKPAEKEINKDTFSKLENLGMTFITKLYMACDIYNQNEDVNNDNILKLLRVIGFGWDKVILGVEQETSIILKPFKLRIIEAIQETKYFFISLQYLRKHNIEQKNLISIKNRAAYLNRRTSNDSREISNPDNQNDAMGIILDLLSKEIELSKHPFYFIFYQLNSTTIEYKSSNELVSELKDLSANANSNRLEEQVMLFEQKNIAFINNTIACQKQNELWRQRRIKSLELLDRNLKRGIEEYPDTFIVTEHNQNPKSNMILLQQKIDYILRLVKTFFGITFFDEQNEDFYGFDAFVHGIFTNEVKLFREILIHAYESNQANKNPLKLLVESTFISPNDPPPRDGKEQAVIRRINKVFAVPEEVEHIHTAGMSNAN